MTHSDFSYAFSTAAAHHNVRAYRCCCWIYKLSLMYVVCLKLIGRFLWYSAKHFHSRVLIDITLQWMYYSSFSPISTTVYCLCSAVIQHFKMFLYWIFYMVVPRAYISPWDVTRVLVHCDWCVQAVVHSDRLPLALYVHALHVLVTWHCAAFCCGRGSCPFASFFGNRVHRRGCNDIHWCKYFVAMPSHVVQHDTSMSRA